MRLELQRDCPNRPRPPLTARNLLLRVPFSRVPAPRGMIDIKAGQGAGL